MSSLIGKTLGSYELVELAGQGGMAAVYRGFDRTSKVWVAVKVLSPALVEDSTFVRRFEREARLLADLKHPSIVPILEFGQANGYLFLVMPFYQEGSLARRMARGPILPLDGGHIIDQVAGALDHAHQKGVIHRDVKPSNILLEGDTAHLADFGLAHIGDASVSLTGSALIGTPAYVSPEAASGEAIGPASDQYALGVILFELTTGRLPFDGDTPMAALIHVLQEPFPRPREVNPRIPEGVERVILKSTARDPAERFATVGEMNRAFQAAVQYALNPGLPSPPRVVIPPSARLRPDVRTTQPLPPAKPKRRKRTYALLAGLLVLLAFACPVGASSALDLLRAFTNPAESSGPPSVPGIEMTAAAATIESLSTAVAASHFGLAGPDAINTAVAQTLAALNPTATDTGTVEPAASETAASTGFATLVAGVGGSSTATRTQTRTPTLTRTATPTRTATASFTPSGSNTAGPSPTAGASATPSSTLAMTGTASATGSPSATTAAPSTPTSAPPTATVVPIDCADYSMGSWFFFFTRARVHVINGGPTPVKIVGIDISWPDANEDLDEINLRSNTIWDIGADESPASISSGWVGNRWIGSGANDVLEFNFKNPAETSGYSVDVSFDNGCSVSDSK